MENEIYERDYTQQGKILPRKGPEEVDFFWTHMLGEQEAKECSEIIKSMPKVVNPTGKAQYERIFNYLDSVARKIGGKIKSVINYQDYYAEMTVDLPYLEKSFQDNTNLVLWGIWFSPEYLSIVPIDSDWLRLTLRMNHYFLDMIDEDKRSAMINGGIINEPEAFEAIYKQFDKLFCGTDEE